MKRTATIKIKKPKRTPAMPILKMLSPKKVKNI